jgi:anti-sigma-K factor RskA
MVDADVTVRFKNQPGSRTASARGAWTQMPWRAWIATPAFAAASVALALGLGGYAFYLHSRLATETAAREQLEASIQRQAAQIAAIQELLAKAQDRNKSFEDDTNRLRARLAALEQESVRLSAALAQRDELLAFQQSADTKVVALAGSAKAKSAAGLLLYDPGNKKAFFYAFNLPPLQQGKTYQLWAIANKPVNAGIFNADKGRKGRMVTPPLPEFPRIRQFVVSVEPEGGNPQPSGITYLISRR